MYYTRLTPASPAITGYASPITYEAHGGITSMTLGNSLVENWSYNLARMQPEVIQLGTATSPASVVKLETAYCDAGFQVACATNNGNVKMDRITAGTGNWARRYQYDFANRLIQANEYSLASGALAPASPTCPDPTPNSGSVWCEAYSYDSYANRLISTRSGLTAPFNEPLAFDAATNRVTLPSTAPSGTTNYWQYDEAGNVIQDGSQMPFSYDGENRIVNANGTAYGYDGAGKRVRRTSGGLTTTFVYGPDDQLAAEYGGSTPLVTGRLYTTVDQLGTTRVVTDASQNPVVVERADYLPFGEQLLVSKGSTRATVGDGYGASSDVTVRFTGKERDSETGLDYFGARYLSSAQGRFTSTDPISGTVLHMLNPQRWNMYVYAVNNPLAYLDQDGRDAIAVKFGSLAKNLGHAGVASVHHDGKGTFADFGPQHGGQAHDAGKYNFVEFKTQLVYGADGKPTKESLSALANELADNEQQPHDSVSVAYFKTSDAETAALDAYINAAKEQERNGKTPPYWVGFRDCIGFCINGLEKAGKNFGGSSILTIPNYEYIQFWLSADQTSTGTNPPKEKITSKVCYTDEKGKRVCQ